MTSPTVNNLVNPVKGHTVNLTHPTAQYTPHNAEMTVQSNETTETHQMTDSDQQTYQSTMAADSVVQARSIQHEFVEEGRQNPLRVECNVSRKIENYV